jgi:carbamoyl-phosphate synthase small subunit
LVQYLTEHGIMALTDIDTRALTRHLRQFGALRGIISTVDLDPVSLQKKALASPTTSDVDLVAEVTCTEPYHWAEPVDGPWLREIPSHGSEVTAPADCTPQYHVVAYDCGIKRNIMRQLVSSGCRITVVPANTPASEALSMQPDGVFLSNGPGDPEQVPYTISAVRELLGQVPIFGICLGHQVLGLALGGPKYKLKFGHHGSNHPVKNLETGQIAITAQNHNFVIDVEAIRDQVELTHVNLYDGTVEGMRHRALPAFSVQYHPEAAPGPHDANPLFAQFVEMMAEEQA